MNRDKLIRELRKYAKENGLEFAVDTKKGKGSHYGVRLGDKKTTVQSDIDEFRAARIKKQLGVAE
jgi:hypothetical protein